MSACLNLTQDFCFPPASLLILIPAPRLGNSSKEAKEIGSRYAFFPVIKSVHKAYLVRLDEKKQGLPVIFAVYFNIGHFGMVINT